MHLTRRFLLTAAPILLAAASLPAVDPLPERVLTLEPNGRPRTDLNLSSTHVTGTLDAARLPAGVGSASLTGVARLTGTDATALDHASLTGISVGDVRQVMLTTGDLSGFTGGMDRSTSLPLAYVAATFRLVNSTEPTALPDVVATQTAGRAWKLVSATLSSGDVVLPNGVAAYKEGFFKVGVFLVQDDISSIDLRDYISISTSTASLQMFGGSINSYGGSLYLADHNIDVSQGVFIDPTIYGGSIHTAGTGTIDTSNGGCIITNGAGSPEGVVSAPVGSLYCDQTGTPGAVLYVKEPGDDSSHGWAAK